MSDRNAHMKDGREKPVQAGSGAGITNSHYWKITIVVGALIAAVGFLFYVQPDRKADAVEMVVYKSPSCNCCGKWVDHMRDAGFKVTTRDSNNLDIIKSQFGIMPGLRSCHTAVVEGYVVEGHVPADDIKRLLQERPDVAGLAVPEMPMGSPGMEGPYKDPYKVLAFDRNSQTTIYARH